MQVFKYKVSLSHDKGTVNLTTASTSAGAAIDTILKAEGAPLSAVKSVRNLGLVA